LPELEIKPNDILVSRANTTELLGSAALVKSVRPRLLLCDKLFRLSARQKVDRRFLTYSLASASVRYQFERDATGASSSMKNIGQDTLRNSFIIRFPPEEQVAIADFLDRTTANLEAASRQIAAQLGKLGEYRQALITAAVMGQIALRKEAA
jgi:type I restriction enzyme, S subunit